MKSGPSCTHVGKGNRLKMFEKVRFSRAVKKDGHPDFCIGDHHVGAVADVVLKSAQRSDAGLVGVRDVGIDGGVGIARKGKAVVRSAKHVKQLFLANGPIACRSQGQNPGPHQREVSACVEPNGAKGPAIVRCRESGI